jgi:hypothetical protein
MRAQRPSGLAIEPTVLYQKANKAMLTILERVTIGERKFTVYEDSRAKRTKWQVWERTDPRNSVRVYAGSRAGAYDYLASIEGKRTYV